MPTQAADDQAERDSTTPGTATAARYGTGRRTASPPLVHQGC